MADKQNRNKNTDSLKYMLGPAQIQQIVCVCQLNN